MSDVLRVVCEECGTARTYCGGDAATRARADLCSCGCVMLRDAPRTTPHSSERCALTPAQRDTAARLLASVFGG